MKATWKSKRASLAAALLGAGVLAGSIALTAPAASATTNVSATVSAGTLSFGTISYPSWSSITLNGTNQTVNSTGASIPVQDYTGSGAGWDITETATVLTSGSNTLPGAVTLSSAPSFSCNGAGTCTTPTSNTGSGAVTYPFTLATSSTKMYSATANTGMGSVVSSPTFVLAVPANAYAGTYTATWTFSLVSGP